jgi:hypothetical protein
LKPERWGVLLVQEEKYQGGKPVISGYNNNNKKKKKKKKEKLSLCLTEHHAMKASWGSGGVSPLIL